MPRAWLLVFALLFVVNVCPAQDTKSQESKSPEAKAAPTTPTAAYYPVPVSASRQANPVKVTAESLAAGKKVYTYDCALCHGTAGDGKGDAPKEMKIPNLTDPSTQSSRTDGDLFYIIKTGHGDMPPEGDRVKIDQIWDIVNYVRSLAKKGSGGKKPPAEKPDGGENPPADKPAANDKPSN